MPPHVPRRAAPPQIKHGQQRNFREISR